jgi:hypothetical protein
VSVKRTKTGYQVDVRLADDKRHRKSFRTKQAADKYEREMLDQREQGVLPTHGSGTLADFIAEWKSTVYPTIRANTISGYESALNQHILPAFGELKLQKIDQRLVQDWVNDLVAEGLSPRTEDAKAADDRRDRTPRPRHRPALQGDGQARRLLRPPPIRMLGTPSQQHRL